MTPDSTPAHVYVVKLFTCEGTAPGALCGRLEHVASGRRHDFDDGHALLDCLRHEERQVARELGVPPAAG